MYKYIIIFLISATCFFSNMPAEEQEHELLKVADVSRVMKQILDQHVDTKEMSGKILKHSFRIYFDQFDPSRIYLLQSEVDPWINISESDLTNIVTQYKNSDFTAFEKINAIIAKAIERNRKIREDFFLQPDALFVNAQKNGYPNEKAPFAADMQVLTENIKTHLSRFLGQELAQFGENEVLTHKAETLAIYERQLRAYENRYLFLNNDGTALTSHERENVFILNILKALASSLDAHTTVYNPNEAYEMKVRLEKEFLGIGVVLKPGPDGTVYVTKLVSGGPAEKSGLMKVNDKILSVDGKSTIGQPFQTITQSMRGKKGSLVNLSVERIIGGSPRIFEIQLMRDTIAVSDDRVRSTYETFGNGIIGKITIPAFYQGDNGISTEADLRKELLELKKQGNLRGLIIDMRENSGGFLSQAVKVAGMFITNGVVVISKYSNGEEKIYRDMDARIDYQGPLIVLTSKATASAAEIVAQALQDYGVALVVGDERTYGKGTIQSQTVTGNKGNTSYFKVTVGKYYTVSGRTPQLQGVKADILIPSEFANERIGEEYLEYTLKPDQIDPEYRDDLGDIEPALKAWYAKYYTPSLQHKKDYWNRMVPTLKKNSEYRLVNNKDFQLFLKLINGTNIDPKSEEGKELRALQTGQKNFGAVDLQLEEAVNITKDMIFLQSHPDQIQIGLDYSDRK